MNTQLQNKTALARLMATENVQVRYSSEYETAFFDLKTRTVHIPLFNDLDDDLLDLFTGHEVGHGLETPAEGWHSAIASSGQYSAAFQSYLNVIEDIRIERKIKDRYPGLRRSFANAYKKLVDRGFFGKTLDKINKASLINKINIQAKAGHIVIVDFDDEERALWEESQTVDTWEQVVAFAQKLFNRQKQLNKQELTQPSNINQKFGNTDGKSSPDVGGDDQQDAEQTEFEQQDEPEQDSSDQSANGNDGEDESSNEQESSASDDDDAEPEACETDEAFREAERQMAKNNINTTVESPPSLEIGNIDVHEFVVPAKVITNSLDSNLRANFKKNIIEGQYQWRVKERDYDTMVAQLLREHTENNASYINFLVKEFELRKNARLMVHGKTSRTGKIDLKRIHKYAISSDVFSRVTSFPEGKNHGMVMYIDLSGSMASSIAGVFNQILILAEFCKKVNIPFRVFGFTNDRYSLAMYSKKCERLGKRNMIQGEFSFQSNFHLKEYISSELTKTEYKTAFNNILMLKSIYEAYHNTRYGRDVSKSYCGDQLSLFVVSEFGESLSSTPLNDALVVSTQITNDFVSKYCVDNMINIVLSDGEDDSCTSIPVIELGANNYNHRKNITRQSIGKGFKSLITHKASGIRQTIDKVPASVSFSTANIVKFARKVTGAKYIGFFLAPSSRGITDKIAAASSLSLASIQNKLRDDKFFVSENFGYDQQFFIIDRNTINDDDHDDWFDRLSSRKTKISHSTIAKAFTDDQNKKQLNRIMLVQFAQAIAEAA